MSLKTVLAPVVQTCYLHAATSRVGSNTVAHLCRRDDLASYATAMSSPSTASAPPSSLRREALVRLLSPSRRPAGRRAVLARSLLRLTETVTDCESTPHDTSAASPRSLVATNSIPIPNFFPTGFEREQRNKGDDFSVSCGTDG
jgi:hypothetical protein